MNRSYKIYTLDGNEILNSYNERKGKFIVDLSSYALVDCVISLNEKRNAPLFDQLQMAIDSRFDPDNNSTLDRYSLINIIYCVDFSSVTAQMSSIDFNDSKNAFVNRIRKLFLDGFSFLHDDGGEYSYLPFEKSASLARKSQMLFLRQDLIESMEERLMFGLAFDDMEIQISKYHSYRGLMLTDGDRISPSEELFNERSVIVLPDDYVSTSSAIRILTAELEDSSINKFKPSPIKQKLEINAYDGEGIISSELSAYINNQLEQKYGKRRAASFQIRMPLGTKGVVHEVNYHSIFEEYFTTDTISYDELFIVDFFGIKRRLKDVHMILTESQFKFGGYLDSFWRKDGKSVDPMKKYFEYFYKYNHALYIHATDNIFNKSSKRADLNYQFINTLAMTPKDFKSFMEKQISPAIKSPKSFIIDVNKIDTSEEQRLVFDSILQYGANTAYGKCLEKNPNFLADEYIKAKTKSFKQSELKKYACGNISIDGFAKFLTRDLLSLLLYIIARTGIGDDDKSFEERNVNSHHAQIKLYGNLKSRLAEENNNNYEKLTGCQLREDQFFISGDDLKKDKPYSIWRSPHSSRNEQTIAFYFSPYCKCKRNGREELLRPYEEWLGHLKGACLISRKACISSLLSGADQDGDSVKIFDNDMINSAVITGVYREVNLSHDPNKKNKNTYARREEYPVISIPSLSGKKANILSKVDKNSASYSDYLNNQNEILNSIFSSFYDRTGLISNCGLRNAKRIYLDSSSINPEKDVVAEAALVSGLEIDAVKTGKRPFIDHLLKMNADDKYFLSLVNKHSGKIKHFDYHNSYKYRVEKNYYIINQVDDKNEIAIKKFDNKSCNIDNLPSFFGKYFENVNSNIRVKTNKNVELFKFGNSELDEEKTNRLIALIKSYNRFISCRYSFNETLDRNNEIIKNINNAIKTVLSYSYDNSYALVNEQYDVSSALKLALEYLSCGADKDTIGDYYKKAREIKWHLCGNCDTAEILQKGIIGRDITGTDEEKDAIIKLLCTFKNRDGSMLLYLLLKKLYYNQKLLNDINALLECEENNHILANMLEVLSKYKCVKNSGEIDSENVSMDDEIISICRRDLESVFGADEELSTPERIVLSSDAIRYAVSVRKEYDKYGSFFWSVFTEDELLSVVNPMEVKKNA